MLECKTCGTENAIDGKFCKNCGILLDEAEISEAKARLASLIEDGNLLFTEGRIEEAAMIAQSVIECEPSNAAAFSLKGLCLEKGGHFAEALESYERAVHLKPDSPLDRVKLNVLRNRIATAAVETDPPNRARALAGAVAAGILVIGIGSFLAVVRDRDSGTQVKSNPIQAPLLTGIQTPTLQNFQGQPQQNPSRISTSNSNQPQSNTSSPQSFVQNPPNPLKNPINWPPNAANNPENPDQLPLPQGSPGTNGLDGQIGIQPITPHLGTIDSNPNGDPSPNMSDGSTTPGNASSGNQQASNSGQTNGQAGTTSPASSNSSNSQPDDSIIQIQLANQGQRPSDPGAQSVPNQNGMVAIRKTAMQQLQGGNYRSASYNLKKLVQLGVAGPSIEQNLGYCYSKLGNNAGAVSAYRVAAEGYSKLINLGQNSSNNRAGLSVCTEEIKVLGGK